MNEYRVRPAEDVQIVPLRGKMKYDQIDKYVCDYFKETQGINIDSISIEYLPEKLRSNNPKTGNNPYFVRLDQKYDTRFDLSNEDIKKIVERGLAKDGYQLLSDLDYSDNKDVYMTYAVNPNKKLDVPTMDNKMNINVLCFGEISYDELREYVVDYYKKNKGIDLTYPSIQYFESDLMSKNEKFSYFGVKTEFGESDISTTKDEMKDIINDRISQDGYHLNKVSFESGRIYLAYEQQLKRLDYNEIRKKESQIRDREFGQTLASAKTDEKVEMPVPTANEEKVENPETTQTVVNDPEDKPLHVYDAATVEIAKDVKRGINYGRVTRERAIGEAARNRNRSAILAGTCILGAAAAAILSGNNINQVLNDELNAIYSWEALGQYIKDLGPITTLLGGGAGAFIATYFRDSARLRRAQQEFEDFNNSFNSEIDLGGEENDRTR